MRITDDRPRDECGVVGVYSPNEQAAPEAFFGTYALQHRGQESVGIASADGEEIRIRTAMGLLVQGFQESDLQRLTGHIAIGHTRYSTTGSSLIQNAQPMIAHGPGVEIAVGHNGNLVNAAELRDELAGWGIDFHTSSDTEVLANIIANAPADNWAGRIAYAMRRLRGAYSMVGLTRDALLAVRDPLGVRPLCIGKLNGGWVFASESCALDHVGADFVREVDPGEAIMVDESGFRTLYKRETNGRKASCVFEHIYFARRDSVLDGKLVYASRMAMGRQLAKEHPVDADMVIGVPDSATAAAAGYSQESGIPYGEGLVNNRYVGRTFTLPDQRLRDLGVRTKLNPPPRDDQRQEARRRGGQHRPRHDEHSRSQSAQTGRSKGGAHEDLRPAYRAPLPARYRHAEPSRAHRVEQERRRDMRRRGGGQPRLPEPRRPCRSCRPGRGQHLLRVLHGQPPLPGPARDGQAGPGGVAGSHARARSAHL